MKECCDAWKKWNSKMKGVIKDELIMLTGMEHCDAKFMLIPVKKISKFEVNQGENGNRAFDGLVDRLMSEGVKHVVGVASKEYMKMEERDDVIDGFAVPANIEWLEKEVNSRNANVSYATKVEEQVRRPKGADIADEIPKGEEWYFYC